MHKFGACLDPRQRGIARMGLLDMSQDELLTVYSLLDKAQQTSFPLLCKAIATLLRSSGRASTLRCDVHIHTVSPGNLVHTANAMARVLSRGPV